MAIRLVGHRAISRTGYIDHEETGFAATPTLTFRFFFRQGASRGTTVEVIDGAGEVIKVQLFVAVILGARWLTPSSMTCAIEGFASW
jgi:hypothetical protein